ncbi:MAG: hypothetical protein RMJ82_07790 [Gemmatales bacterium]|nr:hypothetical protein [Gemmatales bacterium]
MRVVVSEAKTWQGKYFDYDDLPRIVLLVFDLGRFSIELNSTNIKIFMENGAHKLDKKTNKSITTHFSKAPLFSALKNTDSEFTAYVGVDIKGGLFYASRSD